MAIKLVVMGNGEQVICDLHEAKDNEVFVGYLVKNPQIVEFLDSRNKLLTEEYSTDNNSVEIVLSPWIPLSMDREIFIIKNYIVSAVEPIGELKNIYLNKIGENND